jgi:hypothetical protein
MKQIAVIAGLLLAPSLIAEPSMAMWIGLERRFLQQIPVV